MSIEAFIAACDAYCEAANVSRTWLSKRLFADTYAIENMSTGDRDIGVRRLERAAADLEALSNAQTSGAAA